MIYIGIIIAKMICTRMILKTGRRVQCAILLNLRERNDATGSLIRNIFALN